MNVVGLAIDLGQCSAPALAAIFRDADDPRHIAVEVDGAWIPVNVLSLQVTLKRLDLSFQAFYRRARAGKNPGFPRFKSRSRFSGMSRKGHVDGWRFTPDAAMDNLRRYRAEEEALKTEQRALSAVLRRTPKSKRTRALLRQQIALAKRCRKVVNRRKDALHKRSAALVAGAQLIVGEDLAIRNMTAMAHGTVDDPGSRVAQKAGLNRAILDTAPASFHSMVAYKAEEAG